jgi:hypothetical protein
MPGYSGSVFGGNQKGFRTAPINKTRATSWRGQGKLEMFIMTGPKKSLSTETGANVHQTPGHLIAFGVSEAKLRIRSGSS